MSSRRAADLRMNPLTSAILLDAGMRRNLRPISLMRCSSKLIPSHPCHHKVYYNLASAVKELPLDGF